MLPPPSDYTSPTTVAFAHILTHVSLRLDRKSESVNLFELLDPENGGSMLFRNLGNNLSTYAALLLGNLDFRKTQPLCKMRNIYMFNVLVPKVSTLKG